MAFSRGTSIDVGGSLDLPMLGVAVWCLAIRSNLHWHKVARKSSLPLSLGSGRAAAALLILSQRAQLRET